MYNSRFFQARFWLARFWKTADVVDTPIIYVAVTLFMPQGAADMELPQGTAVLLLPPGAAEVDN